MSDIKILKHDVPVRFGVSSEAPPSPENGMIYYDEAAGVFKVYENSAWRDLSSRSYADSRVAGFDIKEACRVATTANISGTYANGTSGVGATLTGAGALGSIDGISLSVNDRVLVLNQTSAAQNGIYKVTALSPFILTRTTDFDSSSEINGGEFIFIKQGTTYGNCAFVCTSGAITLGTTSISFTQFSGQAQNLQQYYAMGNSITTSAGRDVIIAGTEKLQVASSAGMEVTNALSAGAALLSSASVTNGLAVGSGKLTVNATGNITKINNLTTSFPSSASMSNYALANNGAGTLSFTNLSLSNLNDVTLTSLSSGDLLRYGPSSWAKDTPISTFVSPDPIYSVLSDHNSPWTSGGISTFNDCDNTYVHGVKITRATATTIGKVDFYIRKVNTGGDYTLTAVIFPAPANYTSLGSVPVSTINSAVIATSTNSMTYTSLLDSFSARSFTFTPITLSANVDYICMIKAVRLSGSGTQNLGVMNSGSSATIRAIGYLIGQQRLTDGYTYGVVYSAVAGASSASILKTNSSGYADQSLLQYNLNLGNNIISNIASATVSTDVATKAYADGITLQTLYNQDADGSGATISTTNTDGALIVAGTEKLLVSATSGVSVSQRLLSSGSIAASSLAVGTGSMSVAASTGNIGKIRGVSYTFPASQSAGTDYVLMNNGSGTLSWTYMQSSYLGRDASISNIQDDQVLLSSGSVFQNQTTVTSGIGSKVIITESSGHLDKALLNYNVNFGSNRLSNIGTCVSDGDMVNKAYFDGKDIAANDLSSLTLQLLYDQDTNVNDVIVETTASKGIIHLLGDQSVKVSAAKGLQIADNSDSTKFSKISYKHGLSLDASQTATALSALTFSSSLYQGCVIEYRIKDASGDTRVGTLLISTNGLDASIADSFVETSPIGLSWAAAMSGVNVEIRYTSNGSAKDMEATIKLFN